MALSPNYNDTTPAAPSGGTNVKWQVDANGNLSAYVPSLGASGTIALAKLTSGGTNGSITVVNGAITAFTNPT